MSFKISQIIAGNQAAFAAASDPFVTERNGASPNLGLTAAQIAALAQQAISLTDPKYGVHRDGVTDDTAAIASFVTDVAASTHRRGYIPAGAYALTTTSALLGVFSLNANNIELFGDGMGQTVLQQIVGGGAGGGTLVNEYAVFYANNKGTKIHDLTIQADRLASAGVGGGYRFYGVRCPIGSSFSELYRLEILNVYGDTSIRPDGGHGIHLEQNWDNVEYSTTLTASHASGAQTYTVGSMAGIFPGRRLWIGGTAENVVVTATTSTGFTATFANAHNSGDSVQVRFGGRSYHSVHDCFIHDCQSGSGILVGSNNNTITRNRLVNVGQNGNQHGIYCTAGHNFFGWNEVYGTGGYSFHQHVGGSQDFDSSGNRWVGNLSQDPITCHMIADTTVMTGNDPDYPGTQDGSRYTTIIGNTFRCTKARVVAGNPPLGVRFRSVPGIIIGNTFDDTAGGGTGSPWLDVAESGSSPKPCLVQSNRFIQTNMTYAGTGNNQVILLGDGIGTIIDGNYFGPNDSSASGTYIIGQASGLAANTVCVNNTVDGSCSTDTSIGAVFARGGPCRGNRVNLTVGACCLALTGEEIAGNWFKTGSGAIQTFSGTETCSFHDNEIDSSSYLAITSGGNALQIYNNNGYICYGGKNTTNAIACDRLMGELMTFAKGTNTLSKGLLVKIASAKLLTILTTDTTWLGVPLCDTDATSNNAYIAGRVGKEIEVLADNTWTAGNVAIASTTSAGKVKDNGTTVPAAPASYGVFLDTHTGAGTARVLVLRNSVGGTS